MTRTTTKKSFKGLYRFKYVTGQESSSGDNRVFMSKDHKKTLFSSLTGR